MRSSASPTRASGARRSIRGTHLPGMPLPGAIPGHDRVRAGHRPRSEEPLRPPPDTSIVCVIDGEGNGLCSTPSDTSLGHPGGARRRGSRCRRAEPSPGRCAGHPSCVAPGKRPRLTPNPCFVLSPGRWIMPFGTPGGDTQIQANLQIAPRPPRLRHAAPGCGRGASPRHPQPSRHLRAPRRPSRAPDGRRTDRRDAPATGSPRADIASSASTDWTHWTGGVCAVRKDLATGEIEAAADPRRWSRAQWGGDAASRDEFGV